MLLKRWFAVLLCAVLLLPGVGAATGMNNELDEQVDSLFRRSKTVGGAVVVCKDGKIVYQRNYGYQHLRSKTPVNDDTFFRTASVTKMITSLGILSLVDQKKLDLDADISQYFGYRIRHANFVDTPITLRQLMSHTSSISDDGGYNNLHSTVSSMLALEKRRTGNFYAWAPGSKYKYSNFGAGLMGCIIEAVTGKNIQEYMKEAVFDPLYLNAVYHAKYIQNPDQIAYQYKDGSLYRAPKSFIQSAFNEVPDPDINYRRTAGGVWIRAVDLAKIGMLLCGDGSFAGVRILNEDTVLMMRKEQKTLNRSVTGESPYGLCLEHNDTIIKGKTVYGHQGMNDTSMVNLYFEPESGFVIALLNNGVSMKRENRVSLLARRMVDLLYPRFAQNSGF